MIRSGLSRVDDCSTLIGGGSIASLRCPSPAIFGRSEFKSRGLRADVRPRAIRCVDVPP